MFGTLFSRKGAVKMSRQITVGNLKIGGGAPVSIQSMTNTPTHDVAATLIQIRALAAAGCQIVRLAVPDMKAAKALGAIKGESPLPLVADIHFDYRLALEAVAQGVDKIRINPGNIGSADRVEAVAKACGERNVPIRIGVNGGSLEKDLLEKYGGITPEALVESALGHARLLEQFDFHDICISLKSSSVPTTMRAYQLMAERYDYPLHLGVTEAGTPSLGIIKSAAGIGGLLALGIGDTFRVTLTADPVEEIAVAKQILKAVGLRRDGPELIACPTCGRTKIDLIPMANQVEELLKTVDKPITVAVMGCVVNGPGEARHADVGIAGGDGEGVLFQKGEIVKKVPEAQLVSELMQLIDTL
jgi:(E)-4-hydroxy-3-methylbut-2-enyl-diphosphate synthase